MSISETIKKRESKLRKIHNDTDCCNREEVFDFHHQTSLAIIDGEIERLNGMKKNGMEDGSNFENYAWEAYNQALQDQIEYLQAERAKINKE